jgi:hypothetical protein
VPCARRKQATLVRNGGATGSGTAVGRVRGLSSMLTTHIQVAYFTAGARPSSFAGQTFDLFGWTLGENGERAQLSPDPINNDGAGDQQAPDGWEGVTALDEIEARLTYAGIAASNGTWVLLVKVEPAVEMTDELFDELAGAISVSSDGEQVTT